MDKLKDIVNEVIACGECLSYAMKYAMLHQDDKRVKICYGTVQNEWISNGKRYNHAWVETKGKVLDWQTMELGTSKWAKKGWPQKEFNEVWNPKKVKRYTPQETLDNKKKHGSINGWTW